MSATRRPHRGLALLVALVFASIGCGGGEVDVPSGLDAPDMQLAPTYVVDVEVLEAGEGCVIGGFTPQGELAEARPEQAGADVLWFQEGQGGAGQRWILTGHVCPGDGGSTVRMYGGRNALLGDGDDAVCQVDLALPRGHEGGARARNRCEDPRCSTIELIPDGCGGWVADFEARLTYRRSCIDQPECVMHMRWHASPRDADIECTPDLSADGGAWMADCRTLP